MLKLQSISLNPIGLVYFAKLRPNFLKLLGLTFHFKAIVEIGLVDHSAILSIIVTPYIVDILASDPAWCWLDQFAIDVGNETIVNVQHFAGIRIV